MTGSCVYEAIAPEDLRTLQAEDTSLLAENNTLRSRVADLEAAVAEYKEQLRGARDNGSKKRQRTSTQVDSTTAGDRDGEYYGRTYYLGGAAAPDFLRRMMSLVPNEQSDMLFAFSGSSTTQRTPAVPGSYMFPTLFPAYYGVKEMLSVLGEMGKETADRLLDVYYEVVDPLHHYVPVPGLLRRYRRCWEIEDIPEPEEAALVFAMLALGDLVSSNSNSWFLLSASMQLLRISNFLASPSMDAIHTFCYMAVYLQHEGKLGDYWPMLGLNIRLAQSMALHRDPSFLSNVSFQDGELRRRTFWTISSQETALSSMFGRPNGIGFSDCQLPKDISDAELFGEQTGQPLACNEISYNRYTWELASITREMLQSTSEASNGNNMPILKVFESRILSWFQSIPTHFRFDSNARQPEQFGDLHSRAQYVQSLILHLNVHHDILILFRKSVLSQKMKASRKPCFEAAFAIADSWKILQDVFPSMARVTWMHWFRAFHAALICLVVIRTDGLKSEYRPRALTCWRSFLQIFERIKGRNNSVMSCWRALNRLDAVVKKEIEEEQRPKKSSTHKHLYASLSKPPPASSNEINPFSPAIHDIDQRSSNASSFSSPSVTQSTPCYGTSGSSIASSTEPSNPTPVPPTFDNNGQLPPMAGPTDGAAYPIPPMVNLDPAFNASFTSGSFDGSSLSNIGTQYTDIFDIDIQNWPIWLTELNSPGFG